MEINLNEKSVIKELKEKMSEIGETELNKMNHKQEIILVKDYCPLIQTQDALEECRLIGKNHNVPVFVNVSNTRGIMTPITNPLDTPYTIDLCRMSDTGMYFFFEDPARTNTIMKKSKGMDVSDVHAVVELGHKQIYAVCLFTIDDKHQFDAFRDDIRNGGPFGFEGMLIRGSAKKKGVRGGFSVYEYYIIVNKYWKIKKDMSFLDKAIPAIKSPDDIALMWDFDNNSNPWEEIETLIYLLAVIYMEQAQSMYNLIIVGRPSSKKSGLLQSLKMVFDTPILAGTTTRGKGLVPSWGGGEFHRGALLSAKFVVPIDEWFRKFSQEATGAEGDYRSVKKGLEQIMTILDRTEQNTSTGSGTHTYCFTNSLISTDNMGHDAIVKAINRDDPAIMKRYTFLRLSQQSEDNSKSMFTLGEDELSDSLKRKLAKVHLTFDKCCLLFQYLRKQMQKRITIDKKRTTAIMKSVLQEYQGYQVAVHGKISDVIFEYEHRQRALIKSIVVLNSLFRAKKSMPSRYQATTSDYDTFEKVFRRLAHDHFEIMSNKRQLGQQTLGKARKNQGKGSTMKVVN